MRQSVSKLHMSANPLRNSRILNPTFNFVLRLVCQDTISTHIYMKLLDLYSGTGSVAKVAADMSFVVTTLDLKGADINCDVLQWNYRQYAPHHWDVIWASPPCDTFSCAKRSNIGRYGITQDSIDADISNIGLPLLRRTEEILQYFQPKVYFIENPQTGKMKDYLDLPYYDVDYCCYSLWGYKKRTRIFTNITFTPKLCFGKGLCPNMEGGRHKRKATGGSSLYKGQSSLNLRYRIPAELLQELLSVAIVKVNANLQLHKDHQ
jgi:hypothetical protein